MYQQTSGRKKIFIAIAIILVVIIFINLPGFRKSAPSRFSRKVLLTVIYPFQIVFYSVFSKTGGSLGSVFSLWGASRQNIKLREELALLKAETSIIGDLADENNELRRKLQYQSVNPYGYKLLLADVISRSPSNWFETVFINRGTRDGIKEGMAVISEFGVVGRTTEVGRYSSKVMLITDPESSIGVKKKGTDELGVAVGGAMNYLQIKYIGAGSSLENNDIMETSGMGGVFIKGIPVGIIVKTSAKDFDIFKYVELKPLADFSKLNKVFIVVR